MIDKATIQRLSDLPIESVAERMGLQVSRHKALCPFHDDRHPSLSFHVGRNTYRCFVCGAHGGPIDLAMKLLGASSSSPFKGDKRGSGGEASFKEACQWLANESNIIIAENQPVHKPSTVNHKPFVASRYARFFEHPWLSDAARRFLFDERKLDPRVVSWCRLNSYRDKNGIDWLQIPYYDTTGRLIGVQSRNLTPSKSPNPLPFREGQGVGYSLPFREGQGVGYSLQERAGERLPRFRFPQGSQCHIYNLPVLKMLRPGEPLFITEGASDCWAMLSSGHKAIAIPSATLLKPQELEILKSYLSPSPLGEGRGEASSPSPLGEGRGEASLHMFPDNDPPGARLFLELKEHFPSLVHHQLPDGYKDYSDYYISKK